jgi:hypothetical protein
MVLQRPKLKVVGEIFATYALISYSVKLIWGLLVSVLPFSCIYEVEERLICPWRWFLLDLLVKEYCLALWRNHGAH